jgi:DNA-binding response OmpR family regulator
MTHQLAGKRVLIVEDEQLFAEYLSDAMTAEGAEVIDPVGTVNAALDIIANMHLDGATLDLKLAGEMTFRVADTLAAHHIPFIF